MSEPSRAEVCVVACAEAWRGDGAILASPMGLIPSLGARLARIAPSPRHASAQATTQTSARVAVLTWGDDPPGTPRGAVTC